MPFSLHTTTNHPHPTLWNLLGTHPTIKESIPTNQKLILRRVLAFSSLRTSLDCVSDGGAEKGSQPTSAIRLPFVVKSPTKVSRFLWDGSCLQLVSVDGAAASSDVDFDDRLFRALGSVVRDFFIPRQVKGNYMDYVKWKLLHRVFSSALQVLATQAMFTAIGVGYSSSLPSAAALNWVLKDGLGRLSRCIYTASLASAFDTNLKRVRFSTSVLFVASIGLELLTPTFPQCFLLLATIANIAKQISLACYLATRSAVHQSFATADNLGEISAKAQIQTVCFDILGLTLAALVNLWIENHQRQQAGLHFIVYPFFAAMDLFGIYQGLKHVHLQTLTKDRLEIILNTWIECGYVPSPAEVSEKEGVNFLGVKGKSLWPIRIGCLNPKDRIPKWSMKTIQCITDEDYYFLCAEIFKGLKRTGQHRILLSIREGAETVHIIMGLLQACYIKRALLMNNSGWEISIEESNESNSALEEWSVIVEDGKRSAERDISNLIEQMLGMGWVVKSILLSTQEQTQHKILGKIRDVESSDVVRDDFWDNDASYPDPSRGVDSLHSCCYHHIDRFFVKLPFPVVSLKLYELWSCIFFEEFKKVYSRLLRGTILPPFPLFFCILCFWGAMITRARAKAMVAENRRKCFVVTEELGDPGIPNLVLRCRRSSGVAENMASKQQAKLAEKLAKRNVAAARKMKEAGEGSEQDLQVVERPKVKRPRVNTTPAQEIPEIQAPTKQPSQADEDGEELEERNAEGAADDGQGPVDIMINVEEDASNRDFQPSAGNE
ncbi:Root UVB sensitive family [Sesbania bispinosa]|nr:Root UVB sensitive family [Sesbania bispinosa]